VLLPPFAVFAVGFFLRPIGGLLPETAHRPQPQPGFPDRRRR
jgi:hypothetical protein